MQIRLSWQFLGALLAFVVALALLGRFVLSLTAPNAPPAAAPSRVPTQLATQGPAQAAGALTATIPAATLPPTTGAASSTPTTAAPPATSTAEPSLTPTSTAEPSPTVTPLPSITPTPQPQAIALVLQGYSQSSAALSYAFIVRNPNPDLIARDVPFQVIIYDSAGIVLRTDVGVVPIVGAGAEASTAQAITLPAGLQAARIEVLLSDPLFVRALPQPEISFENVAFVPGDPARITGLVRNPLSAPLRKLPVVAIAFDAGGQIIGGGSGEVPFISPGGQAAAEVLVAVTGEVASVALYARPTELLTP